MFDNNKMDIQEKLQQAGLTGNESKVYLELVKKGELTANQIAKNISIDRTLTYTVLNHLIEKGQVSYVVKENKKFFKASTPDNLLNDVKAKEVLIGDLIKDISKIKKQKNSPVEINVYEGKEGFRNIMHFYAEKLNDEFLTFGATGRAYDLLYEAPALAELMTKRGMRGRMLTAEKFKGHPMTKIKAIKTRYVDFPTQSTTSIFGDYVSIHVSTQIPTIILIKNKEIAESYRKYFNWMWKKAKP